MLHRLALIALGLSTLRCLAAADAGNATILVSGGEAQCAIVVDTAEALSRRTAETLADYLQQHAGARPAIIPSAAAATDRHRALIVIDGGSGRPILAALGVGLEVPGDRADAYHVKVLSQAGRMLVTVAGQTPSGAKFGAYRLMEELAITRGRAAIGPLDIAASPFFKTRSISLFNIWRVPVGVIRQCNLESWPAEKIGRNLEMYDAFGFNAVETHDRFHEDFLQAVYGLSRAEWREKVYALCAAAHRDGMTVFLRQWGNSIALPVKKLEGGYTPFGFENLAPDIPGERRRWEIEIRDYVVNHYASHIDHFIGHWADAGGIHDGSHATIQDAMRLHNEMRGALKAINPRIETSFNLWNMANPKGNRGWPGYVDHRSVLTGLLARDVIIAQPTRAKSHPYLDGETSDILAAGYRAAVWTWRRADTEVRLGDPGLRIRIHGVMGDYFHALPESARGLEWHNIERNQHGIATDVNYYVAGKLMWDPKADVDAALHKYCALVFGAANAAPMAEAFLTIEATRDVESQVSRAVVADPKGAAARASRTLAAVSALTLPPGHASRLPSVISPAEMIDEVRATLAVIRENAELCATALPALEAAVKGGRMDEARAYADALRKQANAWFGTIAGGMEGLWLRETVDATLANAAAATFKSRHGFQVHNLASVEPRDAGVEIAAAARETGVAVLELPAPTLRRIEFRFQCQVAERGKSRNAGLAFGPTLDMNALITCQAFIGGRELRIRGPHLAKPVRVAALDLDPSQPLDCTVVVDAAAHRLTFTVGHTTAEAELRDTLPPLRYYGPVVEGATTRVGKISVTQAK